MAGAGRFYDVHGDFFFFFKLKNARGRGCWEPAGEGNVACPGVCVCCSAVFIFIIIINNNHGDLNFPFTAVKLIQRYSMESCSILRRH